MSNYIFWCFTCNKSHCRCHCSSSISRHSPFQLLLLSVFHSERKIPRTTWTQIVRTHTLRQNALPAYCFVRRKRLSFTSPSYSSCSPNENKVTEVNTLKYVSATDDVNWEVALLWFAFHNHRLLPTSAQLNKIRNYCRHGSPKRFYLHIKINAERFNIWNIISQVIFYYK